MTALVAAVGGLMVCSAAAGQDNPSLECQTFVYAGGSALGDGQSFLG